MEMKIQTIYSAGELLEFNFFRRECAPECDDCGDEEGEWQDEAELKAA